MASTIDGMLRYFPQLCPGRGRRETPSARAPSESPGAHCSFSRGLSDTRAARRAGVFPRPHAGQPVYRIGHVRSYSELQAIQMEPERSGFRVDRARGIAGGSILAYRQWLMPFFPDRIKPTLMIFRCTR